MQFSLDSFTAACDDDALPHVTEVAMDLASGAISVRRVAEVAGDFPVVPQHLIGAWGGGDTSTVWSILHALLQA